MSALRGGRLLETVRRIRLDDDLGVEAPQRAREWYDLDHRRCSVEDALSRNDHGRMDVAGFAPFGSSKVEVDDVTRVLHRARRSRRRTHRCGVGGR